jgi:hypothetical protein
MSHIVIKELANIEIFFKYIGIENDFTLEPCMILRRKDFQGLYHSYVIPQDNVGQFIVRENNKRDETEGMLKAMTVAKVLRLELTARVCMQLLQAIEANASELLKMKPWAEAGKQIGEAVMTCNGEQFTAPLTTH